MSCSCPTAFWGVSLADRAVNLISLTVASLIGPDSSKEVQTKGIYVSEAKAQLCQLVNN